ncbi:MAG: hypothetical protein QOK35_57 [Pseudonocardiales bacterium]|nr:hypothetical protein [Pseudonocardiales bacterium]
MAAHPGMRFSVDPWDPSYGVSLDAAEGQSQQKVDVDVELAPERWRPLDPEAGLAAPAAVLFVDGVRRVDAQVWVDGDATGDVDAAEAVPALCASYAAGVVCCCPQDGAHLAAAEVRRGLVTTAAHAVDVVTAAGRYAADVIELKANQVPGQVLSQRVQGLLNDVEIAVAARAREQLGIDDDLIVVDGPLRGRDRLARAVGYIKTHHTAYLDRPQNAVVAALGAGQRTPLFRLTSIGGWRRYTWYLRLPCAAGAPWAGVVRLECSAELPVPDAVTLAGRSQVTLQRYASAGYKDSRAPQNLYPIAGLERALRRRLGDAGVVYRALRTAAGRPADGAAGRPRDGSGSVDGVAASVITPVAAVARLDDLAGRRGFDPAVSGLAG